MKIFSKSVEITYNLFGGDSKYLMEILSFYSEACPPSKIMEEELEQVKNELSIDLQKRVNLTKIDVAVNPALGKQYAIEAIPSIVITKKEKELGRILGYASKEELKTKIKTYLTIK